MKKTLAAVLAAAMALSTASVAFATDTLVDATLDDGSTVDTEVGVEYGEDTKKIINRLGAFNAAQLAQLEDEGKISVSFIVTEGSSKLAAKPTISTVTLSDEQVSETKYVWDNDGWNFGTGLLNGEDVEELPVFPADNGGWEIYDGSQYANGAFTGLQWMNPTHEDYNDILKAYITAGNIVKESTLVDGAGNDALQLKFKVAHTYGTGETTVKMKLRITVRKNFDEGGVSYDKGDTYTSNEFEFEAAYHELTSYSEDMELTLTEVDENYVKLDASDLYDEIGADNFVIYFDDSAAFSAKLSSAQKDVNLYYSVDEIEAVADAYPDVDFEFISFYGAPSFNNAGEMTFNAIGAKNTTVYTFDGETLTPLDTTYDSTYGTVTAKGIKKLTTFVVADQVLEVEEEEEEPEEPADKTPAVEEQNPNTGAC